MVRPSRDQLRHNSSLAQFDLDKHSGEYRRLAHDFARKYFPDVNADDVAQETMLRLLRMRSRIDVNGRPRALLFTIAGNVARDARRRRRAASNAPRDVACPPAARSPEEHAIEKLDGVIVRRAFNELPPEDRKLMFLRHVEGASCRDISERENISYGAVRQRLSRAGRQLRCNFHRLSRSLIPLCAAGGLLQWLKKHSHGASLAAAGSAVVITAAVVGVGELLPDGTPEANPVVVLPSATVVATKVPRPSVAASDVQRGPDSPTLSAPPASPTPDASQHPEAPDDGALPIRSGLEVAPGTDAGAKQKHLIQVETPMGPVGIDGKSFATGPASVSRACAEVELAACRTQEPATTDGKHSQSPQPPTQP